MYVYNWSISRSLYCTPGIFGFVPGIIKHYYHGDQKNRQYDDRQLILYKYNYNPNIYVEYNNDGLLVPTDAFPYELLEEIINYFFSRNEVA